MTCVAPISSRTEGQCLPNSVHADIMIQKFCFTNQNSEVIVGRAHKLDCELLLMDRKDATNSCYELARKFMSIIGNLCVRVLEKNVSLICSFLSRSCQNLTLVINRRGHLGFRHPVIIMSKLI
ncbi:zinc finger matrin-type protein 2 [Iris pallida]|uniref:Zinc finger matrin-type protein 2 n=1 Tax=Iris pallida TaxID=29817 RepID=A0AAX6FJU2_IRIPA|nr:zinc finger matrin-type protein 2 [Iris pallida]